jgi:hypothetical protein
MCYSCITYCLVALWLIQEMTLIRYILWMFGQGFHLIFQSHFVHLIIQNVSNFVSYKTNKWINIFWGQYHWKICLVWFMVFNATFNNISAISWQSVLLVEETRVPSENHWPVASQWQTLSHNVVWRTPSLSRIRTHNVSGDGHRLHR